MRKELLNAREFVPMWATMIKVAVKGNGILTNIDLGSAFSTLWLDYKQIWLHEVGLEIEKANDAAKFDSETGKKIVPPKRKFKQILEKDMEKAWREWPILEMKKIRAGASEKLKAFVPNDTELFKWLKALLPEVTPVDLAVMKHVLWQIKRKDANSRVVHHLCPIFFGKQGGGKTTAVEKLLSPIWDYVLEFKPDEAVDPRNFNALSNNLVCFFDEMANMSRVEMESMKNLITSPTLTYRPLHTNSMARVPQSCTFIGCSNKSISEIIYDPTGMRRFYEYTCKDIADFNVINSIDYDAIWNSIDGKLERGYIEDVLAALQEHQTERQTEDEVQHFVREQQVLPNSDQTSEVLATDLFNAFIIWRAAAGYSSRSSMVISSFGMKLSSLRFIKRVKKVAGVQKTFYTVSQDSEIFSTKNTPISIIRGNA